MKDFNLAKYLKENYQGPFSMFQPYTDLNPLKEESEEQLDTEIPYKGPDPHLDGMGSDFEQAEPVEEGNSYPKSEEDIIRRLKKDIGKKVYFDWVDMVDDKTNKTILDGALAADDEGNYKYTYGQILAAAKKFYKIRESETSPVEEGNLNEDATMTFDMNDPEASEDALEWILDNISDTEDVVRSEEEALQFRIGSIEDMVGTMNTRLQNATIEIKEDDIIDQLSQEYGEWLDQNNLPQISADELLYDDSIKKTPEQKNYLQDFIDKWNNSDQSITLTIRNGARIKEEVGAEQQQFDRAMDLFGQKVVDIANEMIDDGYEKEDAVQFLRDMANYIEDNVI